MAIAAHSTTNRPALIGFNRLNARKAANPVTIKEIKLLKDSALR